MKLSLHNTRAVVECGSQSEMDWLINFCSFKDTSNSFYMVGGVIKYNRNNLRHMYNQATRSIPAGLASLVVLQAPQRGFQVTIEDCRQRVGWIDYDADLDWLRYYQEDAVWTCVLRTRGILRLVTGSGKTEIAIALARTIRDVKWLFLAPETRLMMQAADRYELRNPGEEAGRVGDGLWSIGDTFTCATFQTLSARMKSDPVSTQEMLQQFTGVIVDESHTASADDFLQVTEQLHAAYWRFGMSGTALDRGDQRDMLATGSLGRIIFYIPPKELVEQGYVAMPHVRIYDFEQTIAPAKGPQVVYSVCIVHNKRRNELIADLIEQYPKPCLVAVRTLKHAQALLKLVKARKMRAEVVHGTLKQDQQNAIIDRARDLTTEVIIATKVLQTGTDIEELLSIVNARGNASTIETLQTCGRGMRMIRDAAGNVVKGTVQVADIYDRAVPQVNPKTGRKVTQQELKWLQDYSEQRVAAYKSMDYTVEHVGSANVGTANSQQIALPIG